MAKHHKRIQTENLVYIDKPPVNLWVRIVKILTIESSPNLKPKKMGPFKMIQWTEHTVTVNIDGLNNVMSTKHVIMASNAEVDEAQKDGGT